MPPACVCVKNVIFYENFRIVMDGIDILFKLRDKRESLDIFEMSDGNISSLRLI